MDKNRIEGAKHEVKGAWKRLLGKRPGIPPKRRPVAWRRMQESFRRT